MAHKFYIPAAVALLLALTSCGNTGKTSTKTGFPVIDQKGKIAIVAHRGFWNCKQAGYSENSIASLKAAQDKGLWGSECDIHLTADNVVIVNHNADINGKLIREHDFADFADDLLPNGERRPTFDEYLDQAAQSTKTMLIVELKIQSSPEREELLVDKTIRALKVHGLFDPSRVGFISFSRHICEILAKECPEFINQYLTSNKKVDESPSQYAALGINGIDYHYALFHLHPDWVKTAQGKGMSVNAWTVDKEADIQEMIDLGVHAITTNEPLQVRKQLGSKEFKKKK